MATLQQLSSYDDKLQPNATDIRTEYLEPITSSTYQYTFRLDQSGYLDMNSMLVFKLQGVGEDNTQRVNMWNGALGGIKRCIFQVGDNIINDVQDVYKYSTLKNMNMKQSMRNNFLGHYLGNSMWFDVMKDSAGAPEKTKIQQPTYKVANGGNVGSVVVNHGKSGAYLGAVDGSGGQVINSMPIGTNVANNHQYGITLGMLFPALKGQKIPLFLFDKQRILLTFEFNTSDVYCNLLKNASTAYNAAGTGISVSGAVIPNNVQMVIDYIVMPTEVQNELMAQTQKEGGYQLEFYDVVNVEKNIPVGGSGVEQSIEHRIGQNNREVHNIFMWKESPVGSNDDVANNHRGDALFLGKQGSRGFGLEEYNCNIDGRDEFDHFVFNPCSQYNELKASLGKDLQVPRPMFMNDDNTCASRLSTIASGILGQFKPLSLCLRNGEPVVVGGGRTIGNYPIVWKWKRTGHGTSSKNMVRDDQTVKVNYFCELSRVANILNTGKGMNVIVSY
tara:strand:+ start:16 stop:1521 length:1506 start_codon:yes stop_codon:yes gene_type:complete